MGGTRMSQTAASRIRGPRGFTLVELMVVVAVIGVLVGTGIPVVTSAVDQYTFNSAARGVGADIRSTRWAAVARNRTMLLRFNCPGPNQYRMVTFTGNPAIDGHPNRCSLAVFPFPDPVPGVEPEGDGPVVTLPRGVGFRLVQDLSFGPTGRVPAPVVIEVVNARQQLRTITVPTNGRVFER